MHEEWNRVREHRIPKHVYLRRSPGKTPDRQQRRFINSELVSEEISYYYYASVRELLAQISSSLVKMIFDIAYSNVYRARLDVQSVIGDVVQRDHEAFSQWDRAFVTLLEYEGSMPERVTDVWGWLTDLFTPFNPERVDPFLDGKAQELFADLIGRVSALSQHDSRHTVGPKKVGGTIVFPNGPCEITVYVPKQPFPHDFFERRERQKKAISHKWQEIGGFIRRRYSRYAQF